MDRRDFIRKTFAASALAAAGPALAPGDKSYLWAFGSSLLQNPYDLVAIKGGEADVMFDRAIASIGGMKRFVKKGQTVVVKPNIGWDVVPEKGANTNPKLVKRIIEHCFNAGAKEVFVFDHTCDYWTKCYSNSGIERAAKDSGAKVVSAASESYYQQVKIKNGKRLTSAKIHELVLSANVFINVPILKNHGGAKVTASMKNLMGIIWDRGYMHENDLHQTIADLASFRKPDLNVIDAYYVMKNHGPKGVSKEDLLTMKSQIISTDIVAADAAAIKLFGLEPDKVDYLRHAAEMRLGRKDLEKLNINRIKI
ncbi:MAG: DUF362 domain-containing protein [Ignavibacteria bacterium]|jgi:uncharacterized protein (DUF362 family)|nr:DUF362 domain-containing protein [Ignavibacteria bacterium]MCU7502173.1 DUF362 domain-containing protein [Ignavibacteria bacterium]MCU7517390.1 DUF362 domain-containing protein [Ignavibacteria bacterium]